MIQKGSYGEHKNEGGYLVAYFSEFASNLSNTDERHPHWEKPGRENVHIGIAIRDDVNFHIIKGLTVTVTVSDDQGTRIGSYAHPFVHRPN